MDIEYFRELCLALPYVTEDTPFDETTVVYRLNGKIFACIPTDHPRLVVLKCDPVLALDLRERYSSVEGAWHWNKKYWNQILLDGTLPDELIGGLIHHAYYEVYRKLPKKEQALIDITDVKTDSYSLVLHTGNNR